MSKYYFGIKPANGAMVLIKFMKRGNFASTRQFCTGMAMSIAVAGSHAAGPITLECQARVIEWKSDAAGQSRVEKFLMTIESVSGRSKLTVSGETSIQLNVDEINQLTSHINEVQEILEIGESDLYVEKIVKNGRITGVQVLRIDIPTGKLFFNALLPFNTLLAAEGRCD